MKGIDIAILSTHTENGEIANRPMSNNGDVAYEAFLQPNLERGLPMTGCDILTTDSQIKDI